jgi:hypothetical protein
MTDQLGAPPDENNPDALFLAAERVLVAVGYSANSVTVMRRGSGWIADAGVPAHPRLGAVTASGTALDRVAREFHDRVVCLARALAGERAFAAKDAFRRARDAFERAEALHDTLRAVALPSEVAG